MKKIENKTRVVVEESAVDQILALGLESVVMVLVKGVGRGVLSTVLHHTGHDGWLTTRSIDLPESRRRSDYINNAEIEVYLRRAERAGAEFYLLYAPPGEPNFD